MSNKKAYTDLEKSKMAADQLRQAQHQSSLTINTAFVKPDFYQRPLAFIFDIIFLVLFLRILSLPLYGWLAEHYWVPFISGALIAIGYFGFSESRLGWGRSLGKWIFRVRVLNQQGAMLPFGHSCLRAAIALSPIIMYDAPFPREWLTGWFAPLFSFLLIGVLVAQGNLYLGDMAQRRLLSDRLTHSVVVRRDSDVPEFLPLGSILKSVVILWALVTLAVPLILKSALEGEHGQTMDSLNQRLLERPEVIRVGLMQGPAPITVDQLNHPESDDTAINFDQPQSPKAIRLIVKLTVKEPVVDSQAYVQAIENVVAQYYPAIEEIDLVQVQIRYGYDLAVGSQWQVQVEHYQP